jgi:predicted DsbA family dithiol-disulfide isomerase
MRVDIWSDVICPFCYVGEKRLEHVAAKMGIKLEVVWHSFQLEPDAPTAHPTPNIELIAGKYQCSLEQAYQHQRNVQAMCESEGIDFKWEDVKPGNTRNAHKVIQKAQFEGLGTAAAEAFFEAYMNQGQIIGDPDVATAIGISVGLTQEDVEESLSAGAFEDLIIEDQQAAYDINITGVPFFIFDNKLALSGSQPREIFEQALNKARSMGLDRDIPDGPVCNADGCEPDQR